MKLPLIHFGFVLLACLPGCKEARALIQKKESAQPTATTPTAPAETPKKASRIEQLLDVSKSIEPTGKRLATDDGAAFVAPAGWVTQGDMGSLLSAMDTSTQRSIQAHCYVSARLQKGDVLKGIKLWAQSAGGRPTSFEGPEPIEIGPRKIPADLYVGRDGVTLGRPGVKANGTTIAIVPKNTQGVVLIGVSRGDAPIEIREKLAGCLQSFDS